MKIKAIALAWAAALAASALAPQALAQTTIPDGMHDWTMSAELMAKVLAAKGYHYQFVFSRNAEHVDRPTVAQTMPAALEWLWKGYPMP